MKQNKELRARKSFARFYATPPRPLCNSLDQDERINPRIGLLYSCMSNNFASAIFSLFISRIFPQAVLSKQTMHIGTAFSPSSSFSDPVLTVHDSHAGRQRPADWPKFS